MSNKLRILIVEDSEDDSMILLRKLRNGGFEPEFERVDNHMDMEDALANKEWDIIIADYALPNFDGIRALKLMQTKGFDMPFILVSGNIVDDVAVEAMKAGASDYIMKDNLSRLIPAINRELKEYDERKELNRMNDAIQALVKSAVIKTGEDAFRSIVSSVREWLGTDYVCLGQLIDSDKLKVLSLYIDDDFKCDCMYSLKGTICEIVAKDGSCHYPEGVAELLPEPCKLCNKIEAEGYFGMSIRDESGKVIGILWTASHKKLILPPHAMEVMEIMAAKAGSEIERMKMEEAIRRHNEELELLVEERTDHIKELERKRMESEKLAATGRIAAGVAHEINNPLAGIKGGFMLIKDSIPKEHKYYEYVKIIDKEIDRVARIVRQMFDLSRPNQGEISDFNAITSIRDVLSVLKNIGNERDVNINLSSCSKTIQVTMSEDFLKQTLLNILKNAVEASPRGVAVNVIVKKNNGRVIITVSDQGSGISDEMQSKVFEPFFTTKDKHSSSGMGLGLATTKSIIESMGGTLYFTSEEGKGTDFIIDLPANIIMRKN